MKIYLFQHIRNEQCLDKFTMENEDFVLDYFLKSRVFIEPKSN